MPFALKRLTSGQASRCTGADNAILWMVDVGTAATATTMDRYGEAGTITNTSEQLLHFVLHLVLTATSLPATGVFITETLTVRCTTAGPTVVKGGT